MSMCYFGLISDHMLPLTEVSNFVIMNDDLYEDFEKFRECDRDYSWLRCNELIDCWIENQSDGILPVTKFGRRYIKLSFTKVDELCEWIHEMRRKHQEKGKMLFLKTTDTLVCHCSSVCTNRSRCRCCKQKQKCSKSCHKGKRCSNTEGQVSTDDAIEISDFTPSPKKFKHMNTWLDIENYTLTIDDRNSITNGEWLNDNHINAAQSLLKKKFPNVQGLQRANYATTLPFEVVSLDCVQIINMYKNHWITLSTFSYNVSEVNICDSLYSHLDSFTNKIIASLLSTVNHSYVQR